MAVQKLNKLNAVKEQALVALVSDLVQRVCSTRSGSFVKNMTNQFYSESRMTGGSQSRRIVRPSIAGRTTRHHRIHSEQHVNSPGTASSVRLLMSQLEVGRHCWYWCWQADPVHIIEFSLQEPLWCWILCQSSNRGMLLFFFLNSSCRVNNYWKESMSILSRNRNRSMFICFTFHPVVGQFSAGSLLWYGKGESCQPNI